LSGVIYIGDREAGKTHLAVELTNKDNKKFVEVTSLNYDVLIQNLYDKTTGTMKATDDTNAVYKEYMEVKVNLARWKTISSFWLDTPGDMWRKDWKQINKAQWKNFVDSIAGTEGILLILPPYREIIDPNKDDPSKFISRQQWSQRFDRWINFFQQDCPEIRHLLLCLNKIDLCLIDYQAEAKYLAYNPHRQSLNWQQKHDYVYHRYFTAFHDQIKDLNKSIKGLSVRCFITTIYSRELIELPWIYLGSHLAKDTIN